MPFLSVRKFVSAVPTYWWSFDYIRIDILKVSLFRRRLYCWAQNVQFVVKVRIISPRQWAWDVGLIIRYKGLYYLLTYISRAVCWDFCSEKFRFLGSELVFGANMGLFPHLSRVSIWMLRVTVNPRYVNPRPAGVWLVTRPAGGGGGKGPPWDLPNYWTDFQISNVIR